MEPARLLQQPGQSAFEPLATAFGTLCSTGFDAEPLDCDQEPLDWGQEALKRKFSRPLSPQGSLEPEGLHQPLSGGAGFGLHRTKKR